MPDFSLENALGGTVAGIDEAGRGPLAGPVVAAAVILPPDARWVWELDDSKALSAKQRDRLFALIASEAKTGTGQASAQEIDILNIHNATLLAMQRAFAALGQPCNGVLVDGKFAPDLPCLVQAIIKGDSRSLSIAAASIVAKVTRDRIMAELDRHHPGYGWAQNAGYPVAHHRLALQRLGVTPEHRRSFAPVKALIQ